MTGTTGKVRRPPRSPAGAICVLDSMVREFNRTAETMLQGLRECRVYLAEGSQAGDGPGEEQLRELRAAMPRRTLTLHEGLQIAERQAALLRWQLNLSDTPALPTETLTSLPFLTVIYRQNLAKSGLVTKTEQGWVIVLRADESHVRQRFSLGHELKHAIDDELLARQPDGLYREPHGRSTEELAEAVCDHFSACLLMPRRLLRQDYRRGIHKLSPLAHRYQVSKAAMEVRLHQLGLTEPIPHRGA